jgi:hypothetical protein
MKYLIEFWPKEPYAENTKKVYEIEAGRQKKGEAFTGHTIYYLLAESRAIMIVDCDPHKIAKWCKDYVAVMSYKISPLIERSEMDKL